MAVEVQLTLVPTPNEPYGALSRFIWGLVISAII
jgi:hypothetical protein